MTAATFIFEQSLLRVIENNKPANKPVYFTTTEKHLTLPQILSAINRFNNFQKVETNKHENN